jgi:hypothetical protein
MHRSNHTEHTKNPVAHDVINPLNTELNPICQFLALLGAHPILHVSRIRVNSTSQVTIVFRSNAFLKRIHRLLVINLTTRLYPAKPQPRSKSFSWVTNNTHMGLQKTEWLWRKIWLSYHSRAAARCSLGLWTTCDRESPLSFCTFPLSAVYIAVWFIAKPWDHTCSLLPENPDTSIKQGLCISENIFFVFRVNFIGCLVVSMHIRIWNFCITYDLRLSVLRFSQRCWVQVQIFQDVTPC